MSERPGIFAADKHPVMSLNVQSQEVARRHQRPFEVLVRHLIHRFFHNELLGADDESSRVMQLAHAIALPTLLVSLFLFPAYHGFPPNPPVRPFWSQTGDHYFFVMYAFVAMGAATVYEWDLLFPDLLDVHVLSVLPISNRRLFFARVLALVLFLGMVLLGTSLLGDIFLPMIADRSDTPWHVFAHAVAVAMSGTFVCATFLALQGVLLNLAGDGFFRRIGPFVQGGSIMMLLAVLLLFPTLTHSLQALFTSGSVIVFYFPPFWFLGVYERLLGGSSALPVFKTLANIAMGALLFVVAVAVVTYPLAYRRRVRQLIEGASATPNRNRSFQPIQHLLHRFVLRGAAQRAVFHFIGQTILRQQRQRVMLAMYGGLGFALALASMVVLYVTRSHVRPALLPYGIRAAVPILAFWSVAGLSNVIAAPVDRRGVWIFNVLLGRPRSGHLDGTRQWVTLCTVSMCLVVVSLLHPLSPPSLRSPLATATQGLIAVGLPFLLAGIYQFSVRTIPFTLLRRGAITDLPLMVLRYLVLFPTLVSLVVNKEPWIEGSLIHFLSACLFFATAHRVIRFAHRHYLDQFTVDVPPDDAEEFPQRLGIRDS